MQTSNRNWKRGRSMGFIAKSHIKVKQTGKGEIRSIQFCQWQVQIHHTTIAVVPIYHPQYNNKTKVTNAEFPG